MSATHSVPVEARWDPPSPTGVSPALSVFSAPPAPSHILPQLQTSQCLAWSYRHTGTLPRLFSFVCHCLRKLPGVYPKFPNWKTTPRLPLARLPLLLPSTPAAPRPPKILPEAGSHKWKPFSSHQSRRDTPVVSARSAGAPSRPHRFPSPFLPAPSRCAGRGRRVLASPAKSETSPACVPRSAAARTAWHTSRHRSGHFPSNAPSPLAPAACYRSAAPAFASFHAPNAPAASAPAPRHRTAPLPFQVCEVSRTWGKHRRESREWLAGVYCGFVRQIPKSTGHRFAVVV